MDVDAKNREAIRDLRSKWLEPPELPLTPTSILALFLGYFMPRALAWAGRVHNAVEARVR